MFFTDEEYVEQEVERTWLDHKDISVGEWGLESSGLSLEFIYQSLKHRLLSCYSFSVQEFLNFSLSKETI